MLSVNLRTLQCHAISSYIKQTSIRYISANFTDEQSKKILETINTKNDEELLQFRISKGRAVKIQQWKHKNGSFDKVEQLLNLDGFGLKMLQKFGESILNDNPYKSLTTAATKQKSTSTLTTPQVTESIRQQVKSFVSIHIGVSSVTWAHFTLPDNVNVPTNVTEWAQFDIDAKKPHITNLVAIALHLNRIIPPADAYVLETPQIAQAGAPGSVASVNINIQKQQLIAMVSCTMASRGQIVDDETRPNLFFLRQFLWARLFKTLVGGERVSTENVVLDLLRTHWNVETGVSDTQSLGDLRLNINVPPIFRKCYANSMDYKREYMGQSLLLGMTFLRLILLKHAESLESLKRFKN